MILSNGSKVLVVHRRLFENDHSRFFIGTVHGYENGIAKVKGNTFIKDSFGKEIIEKRDDCTKIFSIASGTLLVYELPTEIQLENVTFMVDSTGCIRITDGMDFSMDLTETPEKISQ